MTPERDNASGLFPAEAVAPGTYSADQAGALIDLLGFASACLLIQIGAGGIVFTNANKIELVLSHGNLADGSDLTPVTDSDLILDSLAPASVAAGIIRSLTAAKAASDVQKVGYVGGRRFLKLVADFSGAHATGTSIAANIVRSRAGIRGAA